MNKLAPQPPSGIPPTPHQAPRPNCALAAGVQRLIAFLLHWSGLLALRPDRQSRELLLALQALASIFERLATGEFPAPSPPAIPLATPEIAPARLRRCERQERLTPGIYAAIFFTRLAAIAARARHTRVPQPPVSIFRTLAPGPQHANFVTIS